MPGFNSWLCHSVAVKPWASIESAFAPVSSVTVVPNLFGTGDRLPGRQSFHRRLEGNRIKELCVNLAEDFGRLWVSSDVIERTHQLQKAEDTNCFKKG